MIVHQYLLDWPELDAFAPRLELRRAVQGSHGEAVRWQRERNRRLQGVDRGSRGLRHVDPSAIARQVRERLGVSAGRIRAADFVLGVQGGWSVLPLPGLLLTSASLAAGSEALVPLVAATFASGVDAPAVPLPAHERKV